MTVTRVVASLASASKGARVVTWLFGGIAVLLTHPRWREGSRQQTKGATLPMSASPI